MERRTKPDRQFVGLPVYERSCVLDEIVTDLLDHDRQGKFGAQDSSHDKSQDSWAGASWKESVKLMTNGWPGGVAKLEVRPNHQLARTLRPKPTWDVSGSECDVAAYLAGVPECMGETVRRKRLSPVVKIGVDRTANCSIPKTAIEHLGRSVLTVVESLRLGGVAAEVWICEAVKPSMWGGGGRGIYDFRCRIQESGRPIDTSRMAFWIAHPAALRRTIFAIQEMEPASIRRIFGFGGGYGTGYGQPYADVAKDSFDEWAPSAQRGTEAVTKWVEDVLSRRLG